MSLNNNAVKLASAALLIAIFSGCATPLIKPSSQPAATTSPAPAAAPAPPAPAPAPAAAPAPPSPPPVTQRDLDQTAQKDIDEGIALYDKGDFNSAIKQLGSAPSIVAASPAVQVVALKYIAFSYCVTRRTAQCRAQFDAAFKLDRAFELAPGERGHPLWGPAFEQSKKAHGAGAKK